MCINTSRSSYGLVFRSERPFNEAVPGFVRAKVQLQVEQSQSIRRSRAQSWRSHVTWPLHGPRCIVYRLLHQASAGSASDVGQRRVTCATLTQHDTQFRDHSALNSLRSPLRSWPPFLLPRDVVLARNCGPNFLLGQPFVNSLLQASEANSDNSVQQKSFHAPHRTPCQPALGPQYLEGISDSVQAKSPVALPSWRPTETFSPAGQSNIASSTRNRGMQG